MKAVHRLPTPRKPNDMPKGLCALAVMTKAPRAGKVKTRLTPPLTAEEAATLNTCFLRDTAAAIVNTARTGFVRGIAVYTPVGAEEDYSGILPAEFQLVPQRGEALGERMTLAFEDLFSLGFESVCLVGSDSPTLPPRAYTQAVQILSVPGDRLVLGPTDDGGYYLIGLKKSQRSLFEGINWSTEHVLEQTIGKAEAMNLESHLLTTWYDVDDGSSLRRLCTELFPGKESASNFCPAPDTRAFLSELLKREGRDRIWPQESPRAIT
jgi:rSAM/selenodomain-associated transferase 1